MANWNPWHGCHKWSEGCENCYVYRMDQRHGRDSSVVTQTADFDLPVRRGRSGYKIPPGDTVWTCFTSDFLLEDADRWRPDAWQMIRRRSDLTFVFITKRIHRFLDCIPPDWGDEGYPNVQVCCTAENQKQADLRLPVFRALPIRHKSIVCEPLLGPVDLNPYLSDWVRLVIAGGESGEEARPCRYEWILSLHDQCVGHGVPFSFKQTGARFYKDGVFYRIARPLQHAQAKKAGLDFAPRPGVELHPWLRRPPVPPAEQLRLD